MSCSEPYIKVLLSFLYCSPVTLFLLLSSLTTMTPICYYDDVLHPDKWIVLVCPELKVSKEFSALRPGQLLAHWRGRAPPVVKNTDYGAGRRLREKKIISLVLSVGAFLWGLTEDKTHHELGWYHPNHWKAEYWLLFLLLSECGHSVTSFLPFLLPCLSHHNGLYSSDHESN